METLAGDDEMKIGWIEVLKKVYGETIYTRWRNPSFRRHHHLEIINVGLDRFQDIFLS